MFLSLHRGYADGTITGSVEPIPGVLVEALQGNTVRYSTTSGADKSYTLSNVKNGNYNLVFSAPGFQTQTVGAKVKNNQTTLVGTITLVPIGGAITGTVKSVVGLVPIPGATVSVFQSNNLITSQTTDAGGVYTVSNLAPGTYVVLCMATGFQEQELGATVTSGVTVTNNFFLLASPGAISGTVTDALTSRPLQDAQISVYSDSILAGFANSDINGSYTVPDLDPGSYIVVVESTNHRFEAVGAEVASNATTIVDVALAPFPGVLAGTVTDTNGPLPGASVAIFQNQVFITSVLTDTSGNYEAPELDPDDYFVVARANNHQSAASLASVQANSTTTVNFFLPLTPGAISGTISDTTPPLIPGARILVFSGSNLITTEVSDENGVYTVPNLAPGVYTVLVRADGFQASFSSVTVTAGATTTANFTLSQNPGSVAGLITSQCGNFPARGVLVTVTSGSTIVGFTLTDASGNYRIDDLAPGSYTLVAFNRFFFAASSSVTIQANTVTSINLTLLPRAFNPDTINGAAIINRYLLQKDRIHSISWTESPGLCVQGYQIFRNGAFLSFVPATGPLTYMDHNRKSKDVYTVRAINGAGQTSSGISIQVPN